MTRLLPLLLVALIAAGSTGCQTLRKRAAYRPAKPENFFHPETQGIAIRRVAMLPFYNQNRSGTEMANVEQAFHAELTKTSLFEVVQVSRADMGDWFGRPQVSSVELLPTNLLSELQSRYGVDAVLFTDLTHYFPYRPVSIGVRTKLVDAATGEIRWAFDYLFDSGNPVIAKNARLFRAYRDQTGYPKLQSDIVLQSPRRFAQFAANETYDSLLNGPDSAKPQR